MNFLLGLVAIGVALMMVEGLRMALRPRHNTSVAALLEDYKAYSKRDRWRLLSTKEEDRAVLEEFQMRWNISFGDAVLRG